MAAVLSAPTGATASNPTPRGSNSRQSLSTRLARLSGEDIARAIGSDATTASRVASDQRGATLSQWIALIELAGLKLVSADKLCVARSEFEFMRRTTARAIANETIAQTLFEDPE